MGSVAYNRKWRKANPKKYAYLTLKANAKRRGKVFALTFEEFCAFCYRYKYIGKKGRTADGYGVDRIDEAVGYIASNIQLKKNGNNVRKYKLYEMQSKSVVTAVIQEPDDKDLPF